MEKMEKIEKIKFKINDWVSLIDKKDNITYQIKDIPEPGMYNDFVEHTDPHNNSFYESELRLATKKEIELFKLKNETENKWKKIEKIDNIKQVIVVRRDLITREENPMTPGKLAVQVAHASMAVILDQCNHHGLSKSLDLIKYQHTRDWLDGPFRKIVLYVKSEEALIKKYEELKKAGFGVALIKDAGYTIFPEPTVTCFGVEPLPSSVIDPFTKRLQLLK